MDLKTKGAEATMDGVKALIAKMKWTSDVDFDLVCVTEKKDGSHDMAYFGNIDKQDINVYPFVKLSGDAGVGDKGGDNEEVMRISKIDDEVAKMHIICMDYNKVQSGGAGRFSNSDLKVTVMDDKGQNHEVSLDAGETGNIIVLATIDNTSPIGAKIINTSKVGTLKGFKSSDQFLAVVNQ